MIITHAQTSAKYFTACFLFSLFYFLYTDGKMLFWQSGSHLDLSGPQRGVTQFPPAMGPASERHPNPCAFLFISCFSPRQKYWVLVSLSDFKAGRKGQLCKNRGQLRRDGGGEAETFLGDQPGPDQGAPHHWSDLEVHLGVPLVSYKDSRLCVLAS